MVENSTTPIKDYEAAWSGEWDDMRRLGPTARHMRRIITTLARQPGIGTILDVGCGEGSLLRDLGRLHPQASLAGAELVEQGIALARRRVPEGRFFQLDLEKSHVPERFDLVVCTDVVEHIVDDDSAFRHLAAMTGGYLIVSTLQGRMRRFERNVGHIRNYGRGEVASKMAANGLSIVRTVEWGFPLYSPLYRNLNNGMNGAGTTGEFGPLRRLAAEGLYQLFRLNSWRKGDYVAVLAKRP